MPVKNPYAVRLLQAGYIYLRFIYPIRFFIHFYPGFNYISVFFIVQETSKKPADELDFCASLDFLVLVDAGLEM